MSLDALQGPSAGSRFNAPALGPSGFLDLLETHLGLSLPEVPRAQRVAVYLSCLQSVGAGRFYTDSLAADAMGTAARLLAWRDEWRMGGWLGQLGREPRIRDLAAVEEVAARELPPGEAERLEAVLRALRAGARVPVASVSLVDELALFPCLWQQVLALLPCVRNATSAAYLNAQGTGELRRVQDAVLKLCQGDAPPDALSPVADGSLLVVRSLSASTAEHWLSQRLQRAPTDRLILAESQGDRLDGTLAATGAARCGFTSPSPLRPALQCLSLAMALCWEPLDIHALVELLAHPVGPIARAVRKQLLRVVAQKPGIGGDDWQAAKLALDADPAAEQAEAKDEVPGRWSELITYWLECPRWPQQEGAPVDQLAERANRLADVMQQRLALAMQNASSDATVFAAAARQCVDVAQALNALRVRGVERVNPRTLEQVIAFATPAGASDPASVAQVSCVRSSSSPAACIEPADEVIWWMPAAPNLVSSLPWREDELSCLRDLNVQLRDPDLELKAVFTQWMRPLLAARKRFVLVLPTGDAEVHPIRQVLALLVQGFGTQVLDLDSPEVQQQMADEVSAQPLPSVPEVLHVGRSVPLDQPTQSFTSLGDLFHSPAQFALRRSARLKGMDLPSVDEDRRLLGTLAHRLIEKLFGQDGVLTWSVEQVLSWLKPALSQLVKEEGAVLLMPGASVSLARFQARCEQALPTLVILLREANAVRVQTEFEVQGSLFDVPMVGSVDLLVHLADGRTVALDTKWGGDKRYAASLISGDYLQLAIYAKLLEQQTGQEPCALGYFVFDTGNLYISAPDVVPGANVRVPPPEVSVGALLTHAKATWEWRAEQFKAGQLDVPPPKPGTEWSGPDGTLAVQGPKPWDQEYLVTLGGWQ
ncbi:PD-(D/E)XK nuclease family protein [Aquabacterium sp.]|uniref:PD-(D/E)XK nuclease family protein n=1 Tax=Aquabacterium sp. TaxID=1872578 RepID=UPI0025C02B1D|nr:PD-(D/E)XK nuclease family protein [Aquabacterium sp.]